MSVRQSRPFVVEIKGKRRKPHWATAGLEFRHNGADAPPATVKANNGDGSRAAVRVAADIISRRPSPPRLALTPDPASVGLSAEPAVEQAEAAVRPRVLPDLSAQEDPIEVRLREEAEARAARRRHPRGPRRVKVDIEVNRAAMKSEREPVVVPEVGLSQSL